MNVDRRSFLGVLGVTAAGVVSPSSDPVGAADLYENTRLRLRFAKPVDWYWCNRIQYEVDKDTIALPGGQAAKERVYEMAGRPLVAMSRETPSSDEPGPGIVVWVDPQEDGDDEIEPHCVHKLAYGYYATVMEAFEFLEEPVRYDLCGRVGSRCVVSFLERHEDKAPYDVRLVSTMVRHGAYWFTFNFTDEASGWTDETVQVFQAFESGIEFV